MHDIDLTGSDRYVHAWSNMLQSSKTSTLKFALARAILDETRETQGGEELLIVRERLALRLVSYYWYQVRQFRLKQAAVEVQEPNVVRRLRNMDQSVSAKWNPSSPGVVEIVDFVTTSGFKEVIPRFNNGTTMKIFETRANGAIAIPAKQRAFLAVFGPLLLPAILAGWAEQIEQYNQSPRALAKVKFDGRRRGGVSKWAQPLRALDNRCFYCDRSEPAVVHVDHLLPWSFVFDDAPWNLVLACEACNSQKGDKFPDRYFLDRLCRRNANRSLLSGSDFGKEVLFSLTRLLSQNVGGLEKALEALCAQAYLQGFSLNWSPQRLPDSPDFTMVS